MWMMPALVTVALLLAIFLCGTRAVWHDIRARRWLWALVGTVATVAGLGSLLLVVSFAGVSGQIGL
jgi:hypothetical protein